MQSSKMKRKNEQIIKLDDKLGFRLFFYIFYLKYCNGSNLLQFVIFQLSGREMFSFNPEMAVGDSMDDGEEAFDSYLRDEEEEEENVKVSLLIKQLLQTNSFHCLVLLIIPHMLPTLSYNGLLKFSIKLVYNYC